MTKSGIIRFIGDCSTRWLSPSECVARGSKAQLYELLNDFTVEFPDANRVVVERGFVTDFGSVPWWAQSYVGTETPALNFASLLHDFIYSKGGFVLPDGPPRSREWADDRFYDCLLAGGMRRSQAWVLYKSVRLGGESHWKP